MIKARHVDEKRRIILPPEIQPGSDVLIEKIDENSWLITRHRKQKKLKILHLPVLSRLPDDPEWDKVEHAFTRAGDDKKLSPPEFGCFI